MPSWRLPDSAVRRLYAQARADRWAVPIADFAAALERSAKKAFATPPDPRELERHQGSLHLEDLALACACASGHEAAWEHFVREHRPVLYRAADAIDSTGGSRELADSLYGELFGLIERDGERRSLFNYFHGRSSLSTWLRAVLAQRLVDRVRTTRRFDPLPVEETSGPAPSEERHQSRVAEYIQLMRRAVTAAVARLAPKDRLRLGYYYAEELTLAQIGRALKEHEATVSRNLARARREIRSDVERQLREREHMSATQIGECFAAVVDDVGSLDVADLFGTTAGDPDSTGGKSDPRKDRPEKRSKERREGASA
jgi:RNA polymerase sigma-70 factor (ECF subfamily)